MGLKVIKISDEAFAQVAKVASEQKTYLSDALDLIVFKKVNNAGKRIDSRSGQTGKKRKAKGAKRARKEAPEPLRTARRLVEGTTDVFED